MERHWKGQKKKLNRKWWPDDPTNEFVPSHFTNSHMMSAAKGILYKLITFRPKNNRLTQSLFGVAKKGKMLFLLFPKGLHEDPVP